MATNPAAGLAMLRFGDPMEAEFRASNLQAILPQLRILLSVGVIFGFSIAALDWVTNDFSFSSPVVWQRLLVNQTMVVGMLVATYIRPLRRWLTWLGIGVALNIALTTLFMGTVAEIRGTGSAFTGYLIVTFYTYLFLGLRFWPALATGVGLFTAYLLVAAAHQVPGIAIAYNGLFLAFANVLAATALYNLELSRRSNFLEARRLRELSARDPLTQLSNRASFSQHLAAVWSEAKENNHTLILAILDIDHFKDYNDHYGHQAGDACLQQVADLLRRAVQRPLDRVGRFGGEEFVVLLPDCEQQAGQERLEAVRASVQAAAIPHAKSETAPVVTVSVGFAEVRPSHSQRSTEGLIQLADEALYTAKAQGRNRVVKAVQRDFVETGVFRRPIEAPS